MIKEEVALAISLEEVLHDVLRQRGRLVVKPSGISMGPHYRSADAIVIEPMPAHTVPIGTVIVFPRDDYCVAHRVVASRSRGGENWYLTWGDAAGCPDVLPLRHGSAVGVVTGIRGAKRTVNLRSAAQRVLARLRVARILTAGLLRHPRASVRAMVALLNESES